jgi:hypothetical protein
MRKFISILAFSCILATSFCASFAKGKKEISTLEVDYTTLNGETVVELAENTNYQIEFINLPENISSTQLKKRFSGKFMNIRGKREKTSDLSSSHRVRVKKAKAGFEGKVRLRLFEKIEASDDDGNDDDSDDEGSTKLRNEDKDNLLVETIEFTLQIPEDDSGDDDSGSDDGGNDNSPGANVEVDYSTLTSNSAVEISKKTKTISFVNLPEGAVSAKLKKDFKGKFVNIRSKRETITEASSSHRIRVKKAKPGFEGDVELYLYSSSSDEEDSSKSRTEDDDDDDEDETLLETIEFEIFIAGADDSDDDDNDDDDNDDDDDDNS